jgi:antitoxin (DNA-binding transcriptional repressor) of toxin-antitoxin stability system
VRAGEPVIVCDRNTPIARLVPYGDPEPDEFRVDEPAGAPAELAAIRGVRPRRPIDVVRLLRQSRDHR